MTKRDSMISALVSLAVCIIFWMFAPPLQPTSGIAKDPTVYDSVRSAKKIRAAYAVGAPLFMVDPNTKHKSGVFYEIVELAAQKLGLSVDWNEEVGYGEMIQGLSNRRYDIVGSGVWMNSSRGAAADFSLPAYYESVYAYSRMDDTRFDENLAILDSPQFTISTMDGEMNAQIAASDFPLASTTQLPQAADFSQLALNVVNRKADVVFLSLAAARSYQVANPTHIRQISAPPLRVFPVSLMMKKGEYDLKQSLDAALTEMHTQGEIESILRKYEAQPGSYLRVATPYREARLEK